MVNKTRNKRDFFSALANEWSFREVDWNRLNRALSFITFQPGDCVADIGCGTGIIIPALKSAVSPNGDVYCIDFSEEMLIEAKKEKLNSGVYYITADGEELPLKNDFSHHVVCLAVFAHFTHKEAALNEFHRILRPNGIVSIIHLIGSTELAEIHKKAGQPIENDLLPQQEELEQLFSNAGFHSPKIIDEPELYFAQAKK